METRIVSLARSVRERPEDLVALERLIAALRRSGQLHAMAALVEWWAAMVNDEATPAQTLCALYCRLAERVNPSTARNLARTALAISPGSDEALELFEKHAGDEDRDELCDRYLAFLRESPFANASPRVRVKLIDRLLETGRYDEALAQVQALPPRSALKPGSQDMAEACRVPEEQRAKEVEPPRVTKLPEPERVSRMPETPRLTQAPRPGPRITQAPEPKRATPAPEERRSARISGVIPVPRREPEPMLVLEDGDIEVVWHDEPAPSEQRDSSVRLLRKDEAPRRPASRTA